MSSHHLMRGVLFLVLGLLTFDATGAVWYVTSGGTGSGNSWAEAGPLQTVVNSAQAGDEVWVAAGTYSGTTNPVLIMKFGVALYGGFVGGEIVRETRDWTANPTIIDGENQRRCVNGADEAVLDGFILTRGWSNTFGGGLHNHYTSPILQNCTFTHNKAEYGGAGIHNSHSSPEIISCRFVENEANGMVVFGGAAMYNTSSSPVITWCEFHDNSTWGGGGAILNYPGQPTISHCDFRRNHADTGGAIYSGEMHNMGFTYTVTHCIFVENESGSGGALYNEEAVSMVLSHSTFQRNRGGHSGGAIVNGMVNWPGQGQQIDSCLFLENTGGRGGAIYNEYAHYTRIENSIFVSNRAQSIEGGGAVYNSSSTPKIMNCTFTRNAAVHANGAGGAMFNAMASPVLTNCILWENSAWEGPEIHNPSYYTNNPLVTYSCVAGGFPGEGNIDADPRFVHSLYSLQLRADSPCLDAGTSEGAPATDILDRPRPMGAAVDMGAYEGAVAQENIVTLTLDVQPAEYGSTEPPAGTYTYARGEQVSLYAQGRGMRFVGWTGDIDSGTRTFSLLMDSDKVVTAVFTASILRVKAGSTTPVPDGTTWATAFSDIQTALSTAATAGGGEIWVAAGVYTSEANPVVAMEPGVFLYGGFSGLETNRSQRNWEAHPAILDGENQRRCLTGANDARLDGFVVRRGHAEYGGGMYNRRVSPEVVHCVFEQNTALDLGGGLHFEEAASIISDCTFVLNSASRGAGMSLAGSTFEISRCVFEDNNTSSSGEGRGAGITIFGSTVMLTNCSFTRNNASSTHGFGGGVDGRRSQLTFVNCVFMLNRAFLGAGLNLEQATASAINCTFAENAGRTGSAILVWDSAAVITNSIVWNNPATHGSGVDPVGSIPVVRYSCIEGGYTGDGNISGDPLFVDLDAGDLRLQPESPCIGAGTAVDAPGFDIVGTLRPQGAGYDMGAYEYFLPLPLQVTTEGSRRLFRERGASATFSIMVTGGIGPIHYQWKRYTRNKSFEIIMGANHSAYTLEDISDEDAGEYLCEVSDLVEAIESDVFTLVVGTQVLPLYPGLAALSAVVLLLAGARRLRR